MPANKHCLQHFKVVLLGEGSVGKSSLLLRFVEDKFITEHITTLQASFASKKITLEDGKRAILNIWDTAGQERFHALGPIYYRSSHGAILVYDISDEHSFRKVKSWVRELKYMLGNKVVITIAGNKTDLEEQRTIAYDVANEYAQSVNAYYFETSAKDNTGVTELFHSLTELMTEQQAAAGSNGGAGQSSSVSLSNNAANNGVLYDDYDDDDDGDSSDGNIGARYRRSTSSRSTSRLCCSSG